MRQRLWLAAACASPLVLAVGLGLYLAARSVGAAERALLQAETAAAARLLREPGGARAVERLLPGRTEVAAELDPLLDEAVAEDGAAGLVGRAAVYDADSWFVTGTLRVRPAAASRQAMPRFVVPMAVLSALLLAAFAWAHALGRVGRWVSGVTAAAVLGAALAVPALWAEAALARLTALRIGLAERALAETPDRDRILTSPGGVFELTGLPFLLRDASGRTAFSSLGATETLDLERLPAPAPAYATLDQLAYALAETGPVRLAMVPYEHVWGRGPAIAASGLVSLLLAGLAASLQPLLARPRALGRELVAWRFLAPALVHLAVFTAGPLAFAAWLSLHRYSLIDAARPFVGLQNYAALAANGGFWNAVRNTALFTLHVPAAMALALGLALLVRRAGRGIVLARAAFFLPSVTSLAAAAMVWQWMLNDEYGVLNAGLSLLGLPGVRWLSSPRTALPSLMLVASWMSVGYQMVLFQAGLSAIPRELYDAARIDGATPWGRFRHVTLPGLRHTLFFVLVTSVIGSFQVFGTVYVMTEGGPLHATDVAVYHIYEEAWEYFRFGSASAMSFTLFAIVFFFTWLQFRTLERRLESG